ncbi:50S ribosomal protein L32 [Weissella cibaria]|uniref:Large ribosomal subunit protein bL32 n=1 Tax=Weissella cibaria TaxID=137591 RepID=A0A9Q8N8G9_9LACO|nr:50S ribosomal protein L32 [Weissella cibaria]MCG4288173.1 ribosomal protein L32 [Weissella cibaria]MCS8562256.1 50S ribosomal protein L32 [Weissella cibaria]MCS8565818.1 50S ribosomal protein L32 [Weissella cibaria]MCS8576304.1 50S ribosomal protein L32 [Weissella cibaria]
MKFLSRKYSNSKRVMRRLFININAFTIKKYFVGRQPYLSHIADTRCGFYIGHHVILVT